MLDHNQLRELVIRPALKAINSYSDDAEELLILTCAQESLGGTYLKQEEGPALGIFQMEPKTYEDIWKNYLSKKQNLVYQIFTFFGYQRTPPVEALIYNLAYAAIMTRIYYLRIKEPLPSKDNVSAMASYWNKHYNCNPRFGTDEEAINNYLIFIGEKNAKNKKK